jgi:eukaryotic-like serine/threonine-protein kinase
MSSCASDEQLQRLLDEQLEREDETWIVIHVETCERCQARLDEIVRGRSGGLSQLRDPSGRDDPGIELPWIAIGCRDNATTAGASPGASTRTGEMTVDDARSVEITSAGDTPATCIEASEPATRMGVDPRGPEDSPTSIAVSASAPDSQVTVDVERPTPLDSRDSDASTPRRFGHGLDNRDERTTARDVPDDRGDHAVRVGSLNGEPRIPGYEILGKLGEGGMGIVYKARQEGLNRLVALKMIVGGKQTRTDLLARFRIEAEAVARLRHPNILQIYDIGEAEGLPYVALELLEGGDLDDRLAGTPQPGRAGSELMATLARAVHAAHEAGIIHRDLKPSNILFGSDGIPRITDFGLAKRLESDSRQTETGQIMGTPSYMAPEQASGHTKSVGPAADIYALGAILYEVLTARPPFMGATPMDTVRQVIHDDPVPPSRLVPRVARDLETICLKCLNKEPQKRYASADDLADDLDRYREGNTIKARRTPILERGIKWSRRRPGRAMAGAVGLALFLGSIVGGVYYVNWKGNQVVQKQNRGVGLLADADRARGREEFVQVEDRMSGFLKDVEVEPKLEPILQQVAAKQKWVGEQLRILREQDTAKEREQAAQEYDHREHDRFRKFLELRQEAQLFAAVTGDQIVPDRLKKLRTSAHEALAMYARDPRAADDAWVLAAPLPTPLSQDEKARLRDGCYDLLLILTQEADPAEGLRILDRAVRLRPELTAAYHLRRADCLGRSGDVAGRDRSMRAAEQTKPETALDYFLKGRELAFRGRFADAIGPLNISVQRDRNQTSAHLLLAICYLSKQPKLLSAARTSLDACIAGNPDLVGLYLLRASIIREEGSQAHGKEAADAFEAAEADYRRALELKPDDDVRYGLLASRALLRMQSGRLDEAVADLDSAIRLRPDRYQAHNTMGQVLQVKGRRDDAYREFDRAIACHPGPTALAALHRTRALIYAARRDITQAQKDSALRDLAEAIRLEADKGLRASDQVWRARLFFRAGQPEEALAGCDAALKLIPDDPEAHRVRLSALMKLKQYHAVLSSANAYIASGRPSAEVHELRGVALEARGDHAAAIADFNRALELQPNARPAERSRLLNRRGWAYQYADATRLALADFEESLRLEPNQGDALCGRGLARVRLGQWRPAVEDAEAGVRQARAASASSTIEDARADEVQALFNGARIYAQAVEFAAQDVSRQGERALSLYRRYRTRALDLLDEALLRVPDRGRREEILNDPALRPLRVAPRRSSGIRVSSVRARRGSPDHCGEHLAEPQRVRWARVSRPRPWPQRVRWARVSRPRPWPGPKWL